jgi:hypothetical protein
MKLIPSLCLLASLMTPATARLGAIERDLQVNSGNGNNGNNGNGNANLIEVMVKFRNEDGKKWAEQSASSIQGYIPNIRVMGMRIPEAAILGLSNNPNIEYVSCCCCCC